MTEPNYFMNDPKFSSLTISTKYHRNTISPKKRPPPKLKSIDDEFQLLLNNFKKAITGFYSVSKGNFQQMNNLFSYHEKSIAFYTISTQQMETNDLVNNLKTIIQTNNNNLQNFFNDSKIILRNFEIERIKTNKKYYNIISHLSEKNNNQTISFSPKNLKTDVYNNIYKSNDNINNTISIYKNRSSTPKLIRLCQNLNRGNLAIKMYLAKLNDFNEILGSFSPKLKNNYIQIRNGLQREIENLMILNKNNSTNNIFFKSGNSFYKNKSNSITNSFMNGVTIDSKDSNNQMQYNELMRRYKLQKQNYESIINEISCQLESLKTYSKSLEKTIEKTIKEKRKKNNLYENNEVNNQKTKNLVNENKKLKENNLKLKNELEKIKNQNELSNKKEKKNKSAEKIDEAISLQKQIELYKIQIQSNEKQILALGNQLTNNSKEYENSLNQKEKIIKNLENKVSKLCKENKKLVEEKTELEKLISNNSKEKNKNYNFENKNLFIEMQELEFISCSTKHKNEIEKLNKKYNEEITNLRNEIKNNNNLLQEKENVISELKTENKKIISEKEQLINDVNNLKINDNSFNSRKSQKKISKSHTELTQKLQDAEDELEKEKNEKEGLKCVIDKLQKEKENLIKENNINGGDKEKELTKENKKLKQQIEHLSITFPQEIEELRKENKNLIEKIKKLKINIENGNSNNTNVNNK